MMFVFGVCLFFAFGTLFFVVFLFVCWWFGCLFAFFLVCGGRLGVGNSSVSVALQIYGGVFRLFSL